MSSFASTFRRVVTPATIRFGMRCDLVQDAVDPEADDERVLLRLEVDVGGAVLGGLEDQRVDEPDERRVGDAVVGLEVVLFLLGDLLELGFVLEHRARAERFGRPDEAADLRLDVLRRRDRQLELVARRQAELVDRVHVLRVGDRDQELVAFDRVRDGLDPLEDVERDLLGGFGLNAAFDDVDDLHVVAGSQGPRDAGAFSESFLDERRRERAGACALADERELVRRQQPGGLDHVRDQLRERVYVECRLQRSRAGLGRGFIVRNSSQLR